MRVEWKSIGNPMAADFAGRLISVLLACSVMIIRVDGMNLELLFGGYIKLKVN